MILPHLRLPNPLDTHQPRFITGALPCHGLPHVGTNDLCANAAVIVHQDSRPQPRCPRQQRILILGQFV